MKRLSNSVVIGIDLHGTLLGKGWRIEDKLITPLCEAMAGVNKLGKLYICSGNDLSFINKYVPHKVRGLFEGYILETGCVVSSGKNEKVVVTRRMVRRIKSLERILRTLKIPNTKYFGRRLATISVFTKNEHSGLDPRVIFPEVQKLVDGYGYHQDVIVTHSDVAVDILPMGYNKFTGLKHIAGKRCTVGIADSMNDYNLILNSDYAFLPANAAETLLRFIKNHGKTVHKIGNHKSSIPLKHGWIYQSKYPSTRGVIDSLKFISEKAV
ncbi:MAG: hypothetical protein WC955_03455 [Elusimicrobiota bacterium]